MVQHTRIFLYCSMPLSIQRPDNVVDSDWKPTAHLGGPSESQIVTYHGSHVAVESDVAPVVTPLFISPRQDDLPRRLSHPTLPLLSIPLHRYPHSRSTSVTPDSDTPASTTSPIAGVVDLTHRVKTLNESPVTTGGFSDIYRGIWMNDRPGRAPRSDTNLVAIKLIRILAMGDVTKARKRLNREVYVWHRLEHPNIVKLFGTSYHMSGRPSMVMQWYQNGSATDYLRERGDTELDRTYLVFDIAQGLHYLHTLVPPIVHGDLKGNNVLITDEGRAVISDFGLSQVIEDLLAGPTGFTPSNPVFGPTRWQAPELLVDDACQPGLETDVWSFGCTAYEVLTGNIPYHYRSRDAFVIQDVLSGIKPPGPRGLVLSGHVRLKGILNRCWSFSPSVRLTMAGVVSEMEPLNEALAI
ncbi:hypothetical protein D9615_009223 [Tricholomella constricta]|uniref:Protein kinase domain-containing protein n=1 Tax=Tricholomella constricta TaxID=117010 RepID=A0A8H5LWN3_9AGAR|nr:hypothetical protein D9615_009223 [Tricholomella constricta]